MKKIIKTNRGSEWRIWDLHFHFHTPASHDYDNGSVTNQDIIDTPLLERMGIREHVCDILEGGKEAFASREKKYGFKR